MVSVISLAIKPIAYRFVRKLATVFVTVWKDARNIIPVLPVPLGSEVLKIH